MFSFIKNAFGELDHVVWPTPKETKKYMYYTISVIVAMGVFLAVLGWIFRDGFMFARNNLGLASNPTLESHISTEDLINMFHDQADVTLTDDAAVSEDITITPEDITITEEVPVVADEITSTEE